MNASRPFGEEVEDRFGDFGEAPKLPDVAPRVSPPEKLFRLAAGDAFFLFTILGFKDSFRVY